MITLNYNNKNNIDTIIHCADIHIRLLKRHNEYREIFNLFYERLKEENKSHNACLVIAGDVFHTKTNLSAESVDLCSEFFKNCADIIPTIIIPGNHDFLMSNRNRLDNISPIVTALDHQNIFYLKDSGLYSFGNILFNHFSAFDENNPENFTTYDKIPQQTLAKHINVVALSHLSINGAVNGYGYMFQNKNISASLFNSHDIVILGHIHQHQELQEYNKELKLPSVVYVGSMLQQDHGCTLKGHGYIKWNLKDNSYKFNELPSRYGYASVDIENGKLLTDIKDFPEFIRLRIKSTNTTPSQINQIVNEISLSKSILEITYIKNSISDTDNSSSLPNTLNEYNVLDSECQNNLIDGFLKAKNVSVDIIDGVKKLNTDIHSSISNEYRMNNISWTPKSFEFSNMFSYGENNYINFSKMSNVVGLFAKNAEGKCVRKDTKIDIIYDYQEIYEKTGILPSKLLKSIENIETIYTLFKKYGILNIKVKTPDGYKQIEACEITAKNSQVVRIELKNGMFLYGSPEHRVKTQNNEFIKLQSIKVVNNTLIDTIDGLVPIIKLELLPDREDLYDIQVEGIHQYYSNGIVSHNSSIWEAITFCIFDKYSKGNKASDMLNNQKDWFRCKFNFDINGVDYFIEREGKLSKKGTIPVSVKFYKVENGEATSLSGEARQSTNDVIRDYLGTYDDFVLTILSLQNNKYNSFIDLTQSERKDMLCQFMGLNIFDKMHEIANEKFKEIHVFLKNLNISELTSQKEMLVNEIKTLNDNLLLYTKNIDILEDERKKLNDEILELSNKINNNVQTNLNLDDLELRKSKILLDISNIEANTLKIKNNILDETNTLASQETKLKILLSDNHIDGDIKNVYNEYIEIKNKFNKCNEELNKIKFIVQNKLTKLKNLEKHEYDPNCKFCVNNIFVKDALKTKEELVEDEKETQRIVNEYKRYNTELSRYNNFETVYENYNALVKSIDSSKYRLLTYENNNMDADGKLTNTKNQLETIKTNISDYLKSKDIIKQNKEIQDQISIIKNKIQEHNTELKTINNEIIKESTHKGQLDSKLQNIENDINKLHELEKVYETYKQYLIAVNRDGIPYEIIQRILPNVEQEINNILQQIVDFTISLSTDGKNIITHIIYEDKKWPLEMSSGMEKFISSLAIRIALNNVSNLPKPNLLVIDEGFGVCDAEHLDQVGNLFAYLKYQFDFIWIISHLEQMKDIVDIQLEIEKVDGLSHISFQ